MPTLVIDPPPPVLVPVANSDSVFPAGKVFCIARNYAAHAIEMGHDPDREPPFFFLKTPDSLAVDGVLRYPAHTGDLHHEVELVAALSGGGANIAPEAALDLVWGYGVGLDMTRRDLQAAAKKAGRPWEAAKTFACAAPLGPLVPASEIGHPQAGRIALTVNGELRQEGDLAQMIWKLPEIISILSEFFTLAPGDLIMTGTPSGVGSVVAGDVIEATVDGFDPLRVRVD